MPWVPIAESGIEFEFIPDDSNNTIDGSVVTSAGAVDQYSGWRVNLPGGIEHQVRATVQAWTFPGAGSNLHYFAYETPPDGDSVQVDNVAVDPEAGFSPNPIEATVFDVESTSGYFSFFIDTFAPGSNIEVLLEVFVEGPSCFWQDVVNATQVCQDAPVTDIRDVELFSAYTGSGGVYIPIGELSNGLLLTGAETVQITGYFTPEISDVIETRDETTPVDVAGLTYTAITPHVLTYDGGMSRYGNDTLISGAPSGWFYATVEVDGLEVLANVLHHGGF